LVARATGYIRPYAMRTVRYSAHPAAGLEGADVSTTELRTEPGMFAFDAWKNVAIGVFVGQATLEGVQRVLSMSHELSQRFPEGRSTVVFVLDQLLGPPPEAQLAMKSVYEADGLACLSLIIEGTGFWASGIRSMTNNVQRTVSKPMVHRVSTTLDEVVAWLPPLHFECTGVALDPEEFRRALTLVRERGAQRAMVSP
jgi:hypothetical protein